MATKNPRINVTLDAETAKYLVLMAKKRGQSVAAVAKDFITTGLDEAEDEYWGALAQSRVEQGGTYISHEEVWKAFGIK